MFNQQFYHSHLKNYVALFGTLFNNIHISRFAADGSVDQTLHVPLAYGPKEKFLSRLDVEPSNLEREVAIRLPRMSFEMTSIAYAPTRKLNTVNKIYSQSNLQGSSTHRRVWQPVPVDMTMQLNVMTKTIEDGSQIVEQILPYFTPEYNVTATFIADDFPTLKKDVPLVLISTTSDDSYEGDYESRRALIWTLDFTMKGELYGPIGEEKVIKLVKSNLYVGETDASDGESVTVTPGLLANGSPTSNGAASISYFQIDEDDNYGYVVTIEPIRGD